MCDAFPDRMAPAMVPGGHESLLTHPEAVAAALLRLTTRTA